MLEKSTHACPTIGYLTTAISPGVGLAVWSGVVDAAQKHDANLFTFLGGLLSDPAAFGSQANILYSLAAVCNLDGLVIWGSSIGGFVDPMEVSALCQRFSPLPIVNLTLPLPGIPTTVIDSYRGMQELLLHLIVAHGYRRLGFIRGPETHYYAQERFRAYQDMLREHDLALDPRLITPPLDWSQATGAEAIRLLLDERGLLPGVDLDALVGANDAIALGAMDTLQARGILVPRDLAIVGFNDLQEGRVSTPPLTSVALPFHQQGFQSVEMLLNALAGQAVLEQVVLLPRLVVRQSCGCADREVLRAAADAGQPTTSSLHALARQGESIAAEAGQIIAGFPADAMQRCSLELLDSLIAELQGAPTGMFLGRLEAALARVSDDSDLSTRHNVISLLRRRARPHLDGVLLQQAESLWQQARVVVGKRAQRRQARQRQAIEQQATVLREIGAACSTVTDLQGLMDVLVEGLRRLGIPSGYLSLYENSQPWQHPQPVPEWSRLMLAYDERGRAALETGVPRFHSSQLVPEGILPSHRQHSYVVLPLYYQDCQLGYALLEIGPRDGTLYEALRVQISSALQGVGLLARNVELYHQALQAEKAAEQGRRLAEEANSLKSRFLSVVSHELLTPLVLLVGLSEMMLKEATADESTLTPAYRQDLMRIYTSAQHLGSLVRDVLDLARSQVGELRLARVPLDLSKTLQAVALVGEEMARTKGLAWRADMPADLPLVLGDAARLQQVALNLVANAIKFTAQGHVHLTVEADDQRITVRVSDTGLGVPLCEQRVIFDEFRQSERTARRGYGGLGIGLAICRQLVALHGGEIGVRSSGEENGGSEFYFSLPIVHQGALAASDARQGKVLLVTTHAADGIYLQEQLTRQGFEIEVLATEETAQWRPTLLGAPPGAIVLDAHASELGWDIATLLKDNPETSDIPVVVCSLSPERDGGALLTLDPMTKPLNAESLARTLRRYGLTEDGEGGKAILVVDDEPHILEMHTRLAQKALPDCTVIQAANGRIAVERMRQVQPSLVLLDLMMPELDGFGVLEAMQADDRLRRVPVIVLTAQSLTQEDMARLNRGVVAVLSKGLFSVQETLAHIENTLSRHKRLGSETQRAVRKGMAYIHEYYAEALTRDTLAAHTAFSVRHLDRSFREEMGIPPMTYLNRYRIVQAKRLLETSGESITDIALAVGFSSSSHFAQAFRHETGVSPSEYRRRRRLPTPPA